MRVAVVRNYDNTGAINQFGHACEGEYGRETAENVVAVLREGGHQTLLCEAIKDCSPRSRWPASCTPDPARSGMGWRSIRLSPKGSSAVAGWPMPNSRVMRRGDARPGDLRFPLLVKPRHESASCGLQFVYEPAQLRQAVEMIVTQYAQDALVEEYIEGREIFVALLRTRELKVLPLAQSRRSVIARPQSLQTCGVRFKVVFQNPFV